MHLTAEHISCYINGKQILNDISYSFAEGKRVGIIGANGAGKSTLLKILCLLNKNFAGTVALNGENIKHFNRTALARVMAILPQEREIPSDVTIRQLTSYGRFPHRKIFGSVNPVDDVDAINWALDVTHLNEFADRQVSTLSGGERQRAWLAMTLAQKPKILLLDEPTTYLDIKHQLEVMEIISDINKRYGMTIIMVLHDLNHAKMFTDELLIIKNGSIFKSGSSKTILTVDVVNRVFGVNADIFANQKGDKFVLPISIAK